MIRLTIPSIEDDDLAAVRKVLESGYLVQGQHVAAFENAVAKYVGTKYAVAVSSGTAALHLSLLALGVQPGDLIVVTAYSFIATANVIELCGAQPVFVDIDPDTFNIDPHCLGKILTDLLSNSDTAPRVKAIIPVHTFGQLANMPAILELANRHNIPVIEDAACALGATLNGKQAGSWGTIGCFSFHPRKAITTGEGGMITTDDPDLDRHLRALRNHGQDPAGEKPDFIMPGFNYRMTDFQAALGITQLSKLDRIIAARRKRASIYNVLFDGTSVQIPVVSLGSYPVYQSYVTLLSEDCTIHRDDLILCMKEEGIETNIGTWHMPQTKYFTEKYGYRIGDYPVTDRLFFTTLTLPLYDKMDSQTQQIVANSLLNKIRVL